MVFVVVLEVLLLLEAIDPVCTEVVLVIVRETPLLPKDVDSPCPDVMLVAVLEMSPLPQVVVSVTKAVLLGVAEELLLPDAISVGLGFCLGYERAMPKRASMLSIISSPNILQESKGVNLTGRNHGRLLRLKYWNDRLSVM